MSIKTEHLTQCINKNYKMPELILDDDLKIIRTLLKQFMPHALVMAYGSRVKGNCHAGSDLDLVIKNTVNPEKSNQDILSLKQAIIESNISILIDIMDWALLPNSYKEEINKNHVVIQKP